MHGYFHISVSAGRLLGLSGLGGSRTDGILRGRFGRLIGRLLDGGRALRPLHFAAGLLIARKRYCAGYSDCRHADKYDCVQSLLAQKLAYGFLFSFGLVLYWSKIHYKHLQRYFGQYMGASYTGRLKNNNIFSVPLTKTLILVIVFSNSGNLFSRFKLI